MKIMSLQFPLNDDESPLSGVNGLETVLITKELHQPDDA